MTVKDILFGVSKSTTITPNNWIKVATYSYGGYLLTKVKVDTNGYLYAAGDAFGDSDGSMKKSIVYKVDAQGTGSYILNGAGVAANTQITLGDLALDSANNIYAVGFHSPNNNVSITKFNSAGVKQWRYLVTGSNNINAYWLNIQTFVTIDSGGNSILCYQESNSPTFVFLKIGSAGTLVWSKSITLTGLKPRGIWCDTSDNIYITGVGNSVAPATGSNDIITMKLTSAGALTWARKFGPASATNLWPSGAGITTDSSGNVYTLAWDFNTATAAILKYNSTGTQQWVRTIKGFSSAQPMSIFVDTSSYIYIAGESVMAKYNSAGVLQWQTNLADVKIYSCTADSANGILVCGYLTNPSIKPAFIARFPADGSKTGTYTCGGFSFVYTTGTQVTGTSLPYTDAALSVTVNSDARFSLTADTYNFSVSAGNFGSLTTI